MWVSSPFNLVGSYLVRVTATLLWGVGSHGFIGPDANNDGVAAKVFKNLCNISNPKNLELQKPNSILKAYLISSKNKLWKFTSWKIKFPGISLKRPQKEAFRINYKI